MTGLGHTPFRSWVGGPGTVCDQSALTAPILAVLSSAMSVPILIDIDLPNYGLLECQGPDGEGVLDTLAWCGARARTAVGRVLVALDVPLYMLQLTATTTFE